jgi:hypothetical protein
MSERPSLFESDHPLRRDEHRPAFEALVIRVLDPGALEACRRSRSERVAEIGAAVRDGVTVGEFLAHAAALRLKGARGHLRKLCERGVIVTAGEGW